uniref:Titin n=1 Tax=Labrus bergylta TaxID=56723 RepID=A0A3Q3GGV2_9LABR
MINIRAACTLRLFVPVRGRPAPEVKWGKAEGEIKDTALIDNTGSYASLVIENVDRFDSGKYTLTAENASGAKSVFISVRVLDSPSPPTNFIVKEITKNSITLTWEPPLLDGGSKIKHYIVEKRESTRKVYSPITTCNRMSWKVEPLPEGGIFFFRVLAENEYGVGLPAKTIDPIKISEKPQPPGKVSVVDVTCSTVTLAWEKPVNDGGSRISHYEIELAPKDSEAWSLCASVKALETVVTNLLKGEEYQFRVVAVNDKGKSEPRQLVQSVVAKDLVIEPAVRPKVSTYSVQVGYDLKIEVPIAGHPKPTITWTKDGAALKQTTRVNVTDSANHTTLTIKDATREDGGMYSINIANTLGSKDATIEVITLDRPGPPTGPVKVEDISAESMTLSWEPPTYTGGCPISNYVVEKRDTTTTNWLVVSATVARTTLKVSNLKTGAEYQFRIYAENRYGKSYAIDSEPVLAQYPFQEPGPPGTPFVSSYSKDYMVVDWHKPPSDGGSVILGYHLERKEKNTSISHYIIQKRETSRLAWTVVSSDCGATMFKVTKLLKGNEYIFRVMAVNKYGEGEPLESVPVIMRNPFVPPGSPHELEITNITRDSMTVCWNRPEATGGSEIVGYIVEKRDRAGVRWTKCNKRRVTDLRFRVTGLTEDHEYEFRVSAENAAGVGQPSPATSYLKACDPTFEPGCPTNAQLVDTSKDSITVSWHRPIYDGGCEIQGYAVEITKADEEEWAICTPPSGVNATKFRITNAGHEYLFRVSAFNEKGKSDPRPLAATVTAKDVTIEPRFKMAFNTYSLQQGQDLKIEIPVIGRPVPKVEWKKDGHAIKETTRLNSDGGSHVFGYHLQMKDRNSILWQRVNKTVIRATHYKVTNINAGLIYEFKVAAENAAGISAFSKVSDAVLAIDACGECKLNQILQKSRKCDITF